MRLTSVQSLVRRPSWIAAALLLAAIPTSPALAAEGGAKPSEAVFIAELVVLLLVGRLFGEVMLRLRQPAVVGQLLAGIVLGPSVFGLLAPGLHGLVFPEGATQKAMIDGVADLGVLLLLFLTGMETDLALVRAVGRPALSVSVAGIAVPFACGVALGLFGLPDSLLPNPAARLVTALFLGTALSISSIKIVAMVVDEMHFMRRTLGQIIVASAIVDDSIGWIIVGVTFGVARPGGLTAWSVLGSIGGTLLFLALSLTLGRRAVAWLVRWSNDSLVSDRATVTAVLIVMGVLALVTNGIGVNTVLGAFVAGVLMGQSPLKARHVEGELRGVVVALFAPVFFGLAGLGTDLTVLGDPRLLALTGVLIVIASAGKFGGAFLGGAVGGLRRAECLALALAMNARGSTEVIVATIGLTLGALNPTLFTMIVTMAVVTTTIMPPTLRWALGQLPMGREEAERLEREAFQRTAFLGSVERVLLAVDGGASGRLASRVAGLLGGVTHLPVTLLPFGVSSDSQAPAARSAPRREPIERSYRVAAEMLGGPETAVDVTERPAVSANVEAEVAAEARKGYGLLLIGMEPATTPEGSLHPDLAKVVNSFGGARAVVVARGPHLRGPEEVPLSILVPVTGTDASRHAAEVGFALARAQGAEVSVLHVVDPEPATRPRSERDVVRRKTERARLEVLADAATMAKRHDVSAREVVRVSDDKGAAILGHARRAGHTLIVLGVSPRWSERLPFGALAASLLEGSQASLVLVVDRSNIGVMDATGEA